MKLFVRGLWARFLSLLVICSIVSVSFGSVANSRFISPDSMDPTLLGVGTNRYAYSENDPINKSDPSGHFAFAPAIAWAAAACVEGGCAALAVAIGIMTVAKIDDGKANGSYLPDMPEYKPGNNDFESQKRLVKSIS